MNSWYEHFSVLITLFSRRVMWVYTAVHGFMVQYMKESKNASLARDFWGIHLQIQVCHLLYSQPWYASLQCWVIIQQAGIYSAGHITLVQNANLSMYPYPLHCIQMPCLLHWPPQGLHGTRLSYWFGTSCVSSGYVPAFPLSHSPANKTENQISTAQLHSSKYLNTAENSHKTAPKASSCFNSVSSFLNNDSCTHLLAGYLQLYYLITSRPESQLCCKRPLNNTSVPRLATLHNLHEAIQS